MSKRKNNFLAGLGKPPANLERHAIRNDRYDREDYQRLLKEIQEFKNYRDKLADSKVGDEFAYDVWQDTFLSLVKVDPKLTDPSVMRPDHRVTRRVMEELQDLSEHKELRTFTAGDDIGAAMAANLMEPELERIFERLDAAQRHAQALQELFEQIATAEAEQRDLDEMIRDWAENNPDDPKDFSQAKEDLQKKIDELREQAENADADLEELLQQAAPEVRDALRAGAREAMSQARGLQEMSAVWGTEPGELTRLPAQERLDLARRMNNPKFRRVADLFGPMKRFAMSEQRRRVNYAHEEIYDVEPGADIPRLLPTEYLKFADDERELLFLKQYRDRTLLQFAMRGHEKIARGGIVYVHDGSLSMAGDKEIWAKALGLTLLHIARKQKRQFVAIQFGSRSQVMIHDFRDGEITPQRVLDFAEFFFNGGTDFERPLNAALAVLEEEHEHTGALKSDIVFVTDGECGVSDAWMKKWEEAREKLAFTCWGVNLDNDWRSEPMYSICAGSVATVHSVLNGEGVRDIFNHI